MPDIVPNLLRLSSEVNDLDDLLEPALDLVLAATGADAAAIVRATLPNWSVEAVRNIARSAVPLELAAEAVERGTVATEGEWHAAPLSARRNQILATSQSSSFSFAVNAIRASSRSWRIGFPMH